MSVTIKDVARVAGVSVASVSRALNGHESVTEPTRRRILEAAGELRYVPHAAARSLITRRTQTIGVLLPDLYGEFFSELIRGVDSAARARGLHLLVSSSHGSLSEAAETLRMLQGRVDGVLVMAPQSNAGALAANLPANVPTVLVNTRIGENEFPTISIDNHGGATAMMEHLVGAGYARIAFISGPSGNFDAQERLSGYRHALARLLPKAAEAILPGDFSEESGYQAGLSLCSRRDRPQAIFAANDMMALGCLFALTEHGLRVPDDIALAGFDDIPMARFVSPPLTTVRVRIADLGRCALETLAALLEAPNDAWPALPPLSCEIVVRNSSGKAPAHTRDVKRIFENGVSHT